MDPPQLLANPVFNRRLRFVNTNTISNVGTRLIYGDLFAALGVFSYGDVGYCIAHSVRVNSIEIWAAPKADSTGSASNATIEWSSNTAFGNNKRMSDMSISNARPLHLYTKPTQEVVANFFCSSPAVEYAALDLPQGAIIDINVSYVQAYGLPHDVVLPLALTSPLEYYNGNLDAQVGGFYRPIGVRSYY